MIDEQKFVLTLLAERVKVLAYIQSMVRRPDLAEDIFQEVCVLAVEKREQIEDDAHLRNWLRTASRLQSLKAMRERRPDQVLLDEATLDAMEPRWRDQDLEEISVYAEQLRRCTPLLSKSHRELLVRRFVDGHDYAQLAEEQGRSIGSLYVTFSRIYAFLGKCIGDRMSLGMRAQRV